MALEVTGISLLMPLIDLLVNPKSAGDFPLWHALLSYAGDGSNILLLGLAFVVGFLRSKSLFWPTKLTCIPNIPFAYRLKPRPICSMVICPVPISFLKTNTAELLRNTVGEVNSFVGYVLQPILVIIAECLVLCSIIVLLVRRTTSQSTGHCFCRRIGLGVSPIYQATSFGVGERATTPRSHEDKKLARRIYGYQGTQTLG